MRFAKRKPYADGRNALLVITYIATTTGNARKRNVKGTSNGKMQKAGRIHGVGACFLAFLRTRRIVAKSAPEHMSAVRASARSHKP